MCERARQFPFFITFQKARLMEFAFEDLDENHDQCDSVYDGASPVDQV
jgi:hypothetical protein